LARLERALSADDGSVRGFIDDALEKAGCSRRVALALPHFHAVALAARGRLVAAMPERSRSSSPATCGSPSSSRR
jgi:hypothetical protein